LEPNLPPVQRVTEFPTQVVQRPESVVRDLSPPSADVRNERSYTYTASIRLDSVDEEHTFLDDYIWYRQEDNIKTNFKYVGCLNLGRTHSTPDLKSEFHKGGNL